MPRLESPHEASMDHDQKRVFDEISSGPRGRVSGPFIALLHNGELADRWQKLGLSVRYQFTLPLRLKEIAILVTARERKSDFEWNMHSKIAAEAGVDTLTIQEIGANQRPNSAAPDELAIFDYAKELLSKCFVSDQAYQSALAICGTKGIVELTTVIGYYTMCAMMMNAHELQ